MRKLPPLTTLPAFEATARLGSVTAAAEELGRTHGAVSKQIKHLSEDLGVELFVKSGVGLRLTRAGEQLRDVCTPMLDKLSASCEALRPDAQPNRVSVGVSATFAMRWLTPKLPRFYARFPAAQVILRMAGHGPLDEDEIDVILTYDRLNWAFKADETLSEDARARYSEQSGKRRLGDVAFAPVCAPGYPVERTAQGLKAPIGIFVETGPRAWETWSELAGLSYEFDQTATYPHVFLGLEAAAAGLGVALAERRMIETDLAEGRLIAPFGYLTMKGGLGAYILQRSERRAIVRNFVDWVEEEAREQPQES